MDTFFCTRDFSAFSAAFPTAGTADVLFLQGENEWAKQKLFAALLKSAAAYKLPYTRVLHAHNAAKTAAVYLPKEHRFAVDADYFPALCAKYPYAKRYTAPPFIAVPPTAGEKHGALLAKAAQAEACADLLLHTAARAHRENAELLGAYADRARILRAVFEVLHSIAPTAKTAHGKILCRRSLSGITAWGVHTVYGPFQKAGIRTAVIRDAYGGVAPVFLQGLCTACTEIGFDVQIYTAPLSDTPVHLVMPECGIAFFTENDLHPFPFRAYGVFGASRFLKRDAARAALPQLQKRQAAASDALEAAVFSLYEADEAHSARLRFAEAHTDRTALTRVQTDILSDFFDFRHFA
ncbi:MAG: hypothetical protein ACI4LB_03955 [Candidatus Fimenecus sp.]